MANICSCAITFYSKNEAEIRRLREDFKKIYDKNAEQYHHCVPLCVYAETYFPMLTEEQVDRKLDCRGYISDIDSVKKQEGGDPYSYLEVLMDTANTAKIGLFYYIVKTCYPEVEIAYIAEEGGCEYYVTYDKTGWFYSVEYHLEGQLPAREGDEERGDWLDAGYASMDFNSDFALWDFVKENLHFNVDEIPFDEGTARIEEVLNEKLKGETTEDGEECFVSLSGFVKIPPCDYALWK